MPSRCLASIAALLAYAPALCDGFLNDSLVCANVSHIRGAVTKHGEYPVPTPLEACDVYGHDPLDPPRTSPSTSWQSYHVLDSDETIPFSQGTIASALAWAGKLVHTAGPSRPHGYSVTLDSDRDASTDQVGALVLDRHLLFENHTPMRAPTSSVFYINSTALLIPPLENKDVMIVRRRITAYNLVIFLEWHRGALDGYCDFERLPPYDAKRGRRLARRIRSWYRTVGARISDHRMTRARLAQLEDMIMSEKRRQRRVEFLRVDIPEYALAI